MGKSEHFNNEAYVFNELRFHFLSLKFTVKVFKKIMSSTTCALELSDFSDSGKFPETLTGTEAKDFLLQWNMCIM